MPSQFELQFVKTNIKCAFWRCLRTQKYIEHFKKYAIVFLHLELTNCKSKIYILINMFLNSNLNINKTLIIYIYIYIYKEIRRMEYYLA